MPTGPRELDFLRWGVDRLAGLGSSPASSSIQRSRADLLAWAADKRAGTAG
jgi:hypothetical protein